MESSMEPVPTPASRAPSRRFLATALLAPVVIPPVSYLAVALGAGLGPGEAVAAMTAQMSGRPNLITPAVLALLPLLVYIGLIVLLRRRDPLGAWLPRAAWMGLVPALLLLTWANATVWPLYLPGRAFPGFPHGLELVIVPLFFMPVALLGGLAVGRIAAGRASPPESRGSTGTHGSA
ncbi:hypothetical protein WI460_15395 [Gemmatimonadota bacterium Y43]|uniref:hypothetical protein n=1 Tax=Gaopeijia maritima TaxID=3119007 RepID=UPI0032801FCF